MYTPKHFAEPRIDVLHDLIRSRPLATLVTLTSSGLNANHVPLHLSDQPGPFGTLSGHVARANPIWNDIAKDVEVLAVFQGPNAYITPSWYPAKAKTGMVVPTWNYVVAHAYGKLRIIDDAAWLRSHLALMTAHNELEFANPWRLEDAPADFIEKLIGAVVGIEITITRLSGKWKASQNQPTENKIGVIQGLRALGDAGATEMAALIESANQPS